MSWEGSKHVCVMGEDMCYHRGLRTGHELKGATQEPGRAKYFLAEKRWYRRSRINRNPGDKEEAPPPNRVHTMVETQTQKKGKARYRGDSE